MQELLQETQIMNLNIVILKYILILINRMLLQDLDIMIIHNNQYLNFLINHKLKEHLKQELKDFIQNHHIHLVLVVIN